MTGRSPFETGFRLGNEAGSPMKLPPTRIQEGFSYVVDAVSRKKMPPAIRAWLRRAFSAKQRIVLRRIAGSGWLFVPLLHLVFPGLQAGAGGRGRRPGAVSFTGIAAKSAQSVQFQPAEAGC